MNQDEAGALSYMYVYIYMYIVLCCIVFAYIDNLALERQPGQRPPVLKAPF